MKFIVDFHNETSQTLIDEYLATNQCTVIKSWNKFDKVYLVEALNEPPVTDIVAFVKNDESLAIKPMDIIHVKSNYQTPSPNENGPNTTISTSDKKDWWKNYILRNPVFDQPSTTIAVKGNNVHVYIMDSGIETTHPEFEGVEITNLYTVTPGDYSDKRGHGTALASVISGKTCGITNAKIKNVKIFEPNYDTMQSQLLDALDAILDDVPVNNFAIVNMSWIIEKNEWVEYKIREMIDRGVWVICAAGNSGHVIDNVTPASMPEVFTVGSFSEELLPSDFSNYSGSSHLATGENPVNEGELDGWAPGENIWTAKISSLGGGFDWTSGTSIATAIISAVAAYNMSDEINPDGSLSVPVANLPVVGPGSISGFLVSRIDMLDLSDPKYANSVNLIATLLDITNMFTAYSNNDLVGWVRVGEVNKEIISVYNPNFTKKIELLDPLPDNFFINNQGLLVCSPVESQGPLPNETTRLYTVRGVRTDRDDENTDFTMSIYILHPNFEPSQIPEDHPINIQLQSTSCPGGGFSFECSVKVTVNCDGLCPFGSACCQSAGKGQFCMCINF